VLDKGVLAEEGTHNELLQIDNGIYRNMWETQNALPFNGDEEDVHSRSEGFGGILGVEDGELGGEEGDYISDAHMLNNFPLEGTVTTRGVTDFNLMKGNTAGSQVEEIALYS
jgi:hypothetical protein